MAFDFPASPTDGTVFSPAGGPTYIFSGGVWKISGGGGAFVVVSDAAPPSPYPGMLWFESDTGALFFWYVDADSSQWVQINFTPSGVRTAETRNRIVNPAMQVSQENGTTGVAVANYPADQWRFTGVSSSTLSSAQVKGTAGSDTPNYLAVNASPAETAAAATEYVFLEQVMEGARISDFRWGVAQAQAAVVAFHVNVPVAGTYWVAAMNFAGTHTFLGSYTVSAGEISTWVRKSVAIPAGAINAGVWPVGNAGAVILRFPFHCGSNFVGAAGFQAGGLIAGPGQALGLSTGSQCWLTNVGLYLDPDATGLAPKWVMPDEAQELATCRRYYGKYDDWFILSAIATAGSQGIYGSKPFQTAMRIAPAVTHATPANLNATSLTWGSIGLDGARANCASSAAGAFYSSTQTVFANARM